MIVLHRMEKQHRNQQQDEDGFTLLEILLVIVILAVSSALIAPSFFSVTAASIDEEARRLTLALKLASDEAALSGRPFRWSATVHGYSFELPDDEGAWRPASTQPFAQYDLPAGIVIDDVQPKNTALTEETEQQKEAVMARLLLLPHGVAQPAEIILRVENDSGRQLTVQMRPGPDGIRIVDERTQ